MANEIFLDNNEKFHVFSKSPITPSMGLAQAVNKSGHTTTTSDVWSQDIPWFFSADDQATALATGKDAKLNDLVLIGSNVFKRNETAYSDSASFTDLWESLTLEDGTELYNSDEKHVLTYHKGVSVTFLTTANNAKQASNYAGRVFKSDGSVIEQFVASTDKVSSGVPSTGYGVAVYKSGEPLSEGEAESNFIANSYAGIIQFNTKVGPSTAYSADVFEYVGDKLNKSISSIHTELDSINAQLGNGTGENSIGSRLTEVEADIATLTGTGDGSVTNIVNTAIGNLDSTIQQSNDNGGLYIYIEDGKLNNAYIQTASVSDKGVVSEGSGKLFVTADDAVKIATKAANDLEIPEVANATADKAGTVKIVTGEVSKETTDATTAPYVVPTVGALAATRNAIEQRITELHKAGVSYVVADTLPTITAGTEADYNGKIYLVNTGLDNKVAADGARIEYMYVNKGTETAPNWGWEQIGTTTADLSGYAKSVKINNNTSVSANSTTGVIDLSSYKWFGHFYNEISSGVSGTVPNESSVKLSKSNDNSWAIGVIDATSTDKGLVTLTSTYNYQDTASAVTGKAVASAISGLASDAEVVKTIKMNGNPTSLTPTNGQIDLGTVVTSILPSCAPSSGGSISYASAGTVAAKIEDGSLTLYATTASSTAQGVSYLYNKTADELGSATEATVTEATVKSVYDTLDGKIPSTIVSKVNGYWGDITLTAGGNEANTSKSQSNLWGLQVANHSEDNQIIDGFIGDEAVYGNIGSMYTSTASLPAAATKVIGNFVYGSDGKVIDTIRAERMVSGFYGKTATGLTEWVADMPNLKDGGYCFDLYESNTHNLTTFIGDLSSLTNGYFMFYGCSALETFIGDLSSLNDAECMFKSYSGGNYCAKLNAESVEGILDSIPTYTSGSHTLGLGIHVDAVETFNKITGAQLPAVKESWLNNVSYKGWTIEVIVSNAD